MTEVIPVPYVEQRIVELRGLKAIIGPDLAELYGVEAKVLNQAIRRNLSRFPDDSANLPDPDILAAKIIEELQSALEELQTITDDFAQTPGAQDGKE